MSISEKPPIDLDVRAMIADVPELKTRLALLGLAIAAVALPAIQVTSFAGSGYISLLNDAAIGSLALLLPVAFLAAPVVAGLPTLRRWRPIAELASTLVAIGIALWAAAILWQAYAEVANTQSMMTMMTGVRKQKPMFEVSPFLAFLPLIGLAVWSGIRSFGKR